MRLNEGLVGLVAEEMRPQVVADAAGHPRFKYFPEAGEDPYHSFLGVPLIDRGVLQGVLVVQTIEPRTFAQHDVRMLVMAGAQLAPSSAKPARSVSSSRRPISASMRWPRTSGGAGTTTRRNLFRELDPVLWRESGHNPVALLQQISIEKLEERVASSCCTAASTTPTGACRNT